MLRSILALVLLIGIGATPATATISEGDGVYYECVSGKLEAVRGQYFNVNIVPFSTPVGACMSIVQPGDPGPWGSPARLLATDCGLSTSRVPLQVTTRQTRDVIEAYARVRYKLPCRNRLDCLAKAAFSKAAVVVFRLGAGTAVNQGTLAVTDVECRAVKEIDLYGVDNLDEE